MSPDGLQKLTQTIDGLTYPSESDEPFGIFVWDSRKSLARDALLDQVDSTRKVAQLSLPEFFSQLDDSDDAPRYRQMQAVLAGIAGRSNGFSRRRRGSPRGCIHFGQRPRREMGWFTHSFSGDLTLNPRLRVADNSNVPR